MSSPEDDAAILEGLAPDEREAILRIMQQADLQGPEKVLGPVLGMEFEREVVPVRQWLEDDYHMGELGKSLYPKLKDDIVALFDGEFHEVLLSGSIGWGKCVAGDTEVYDVGEGRRRRADEGGRFIVAAKGADHRIGGFAAEARPSGRKECVRLVLAGGQQITLSKDHRVFTANGDWVEAGRLLVGDLVATPRRLPPPRKVLRVSDDEVKLVAYLLADGGCSGSTVSFTNAEPKILSEFAALVRSVGDYSKYRVPTGWAHKGVGVTKKKTQHAGRATELLARGVKWLVQERGLGELSKDKRLPAEFYGLSDKQIALFLNRFWACDGSVYTGSPAKVEVCLASEGLIDDVRFMLLRLGVLSRKYEKEKFYRDVDGEAYRFRAWSLVVSGSGPIRAFLEMVRPVLGKEKACAEMLRWARRTPPNTNVDVVPIGRAAAKAVSQEHGGRHHLAAPGGQLLSRAKFERWVRSVGYRGSQAWLASNDLMWDRVKSIEDAGVLSVYDLSVPRVENFVANGIVVHNTHFAKLALIRSIYELSCLRDPQRSMGMSPDSLISLVAISVKVDIAKRTILEPIAQMMAISPYFMREFRPNVTKENIRFPKGIDLAPAAATNNNVLGLSVFGGILDESAFLGGMTEQQKKDMRRFGFVDRSEVLYTLLLRRMRSRYLQRGGRLPGKLFLVSSKRTTNDFIERRIRDARREGGTFIREYTRWDVKPDAFGAKRFWVLVGNEQHHSRILSDKDDPAQYSHLEGVQIHQVPEDLRQSFEKDLDSAIRDDLGVSTVAISPFIGRREKIEDALEQGRVHPFSALEWEAGSVATFRWQYLVRRNPESGENEPLCCPRAARHAHIDGSLTGDATGLAVAHVHGFKDMERAERATGSTFIERAPVVKVDFCLRVVPPPGDEIILSDVRVLVYDLAKHGMRVLYVSMDAWQSAEALQQLRQNGYRAEVVSVDRTTVPYELLKAALYEDRLLLYPYPPLQDELRRLEHDRRRGKVDHPSAGCFSGDTRIPLLDGSIPTIAELAGKEAWVYSALPNGTIVPGKARGRLTKHVTEMVDVVLDSGAVERCTPEHLWMLRDGTYKEARALRSGIDRLMPITRVWPVDGGYERVSDRNGRRTPTHRMVWAFFNGPVSEGHYIHHRDHEKTNNLPENLVAELVEHHSRHHTALRHTNDPAWREKLYAGLKRFNESEEGRRKHAEAMRRTALSRSVEDFKRSAKLRQAFRSDVDLPTLEAAKSDSEATNANAVARILGCGRNVVVRVLRENGHASWEAFAKAETGVNHKVRAVIPVHLSEPVPVYDLEVDRFSNFALSSGVFVHNSKDISDAVAACVYTLSSSDAAVRANLPAEAMGPSLGMSVDPGSSADLGDMVEGADGQLHPAEDWENDFRADGGFGLPSTGSSGGAIVAPPWMLSGKGRVPTLPVQKGSRQVP